MDLDPIIMINGRGSLTSLPDAVLPEFRKVIIYNGNIPIIPSGGLKHWQYVDYLKLVSNNIRKIIPGAFYNMISLKGLAICHNRLTRIEDGTFCGLQSLMYLDLSNNQLTDLVPGSFRCMDNLYSLDLSYNNLTSLVSDVFMATHCLRQLNISNNRLIHVQGNFSILGNLKYIKLDRNPGMSVHHLSKMLDSARYKHMQGCNLHNIYVDFNVSNQVLKRPFFFSTDYNHPPVIVDLSFNKIGRLQSMHAFCTLCLGGRKKVNFHLLLNNNAIVALPRWSICFYRSFRNIDLSFNKIAIIDKYAFHGIGELDNVNLAGNNLVACIFSHLPFKLELNETQLTEVPILTIKSYSLMILNLAWNMVKCTS